jgi:hypothetical protein
LYERTCGAGIAGGELCGVTLFWGASLSTNIPRLGALVLSPGTTEAGRVGPGGGGNRPDRASRSGQVRFITRPKSRTMRATRQLMLPPSTVS